MLPTILTRLSANDTRLRMELRVCMARMGVVVCRAGKLSRLRIRNEKDNHAPVAKWSKATALHAVMHRFESYREYHLTSRREGGMMYVLRNAE